MCMYPLRATHTKNEEAYKGKSFVERTGLLVVLVVKIKNACLRSCHTKRVLVLTFGTHEHEGYSSQFVCLSSL